MKSTVVLDITYFSGCWISTVSLQLRDVFIEKITITWHNVTVIVYQKHTRWPFVYQLVQFSDRENIKTPRYRPFKCDRWILETKIVQWNPGPTRGGLGVALSFETYMGD